MVHRSVCGTYMRVCACVRACVCVCVCGVCGRNILIIMLSRKWSHGT